MSDGQTIEEWLKNAGIRLSAAQVSTPVLDARLILQEVLGFSSAQMISRTDEILTPAFIFAADLMLKRRLSGESVHRILGWREFYGRRFNLSKETLEPRPDTETLIDRVLQRVGSKDAKLRILDIGTGSGAIAVTLAAELPKATIVATDISEDALTAAAANAATHDVSRRIEFRNSNLFQDVGGKFEFIVSNPPYIPNRDINSLQTEVQDFDPHAALVGGEDGLDFYREIFLNAGCYLAQGGEVWVEFGFGQEVDVQNIALQENYEVIEIGKDLSGVKRTLGARSC